MAPAADVVFAMDRAYWHAYGDKIPAGPELWTTHRECAKVYRLHYIRGEMGGGMSASKDTIRMGANSGYQGLQLALYFGAERVVLLGYDMQFTHGRSHFHGDHKGLSNPLPERFKGWIAAFKEIPADVRARIVNASPHTALQCFKRLSLETCLSESAA